MYSCQNYFFLLVYNYGILECSYFTINYSYTSWKHFSLSTEYCLKKDVMT